MNLVGEVDVSVETGSGVGKIVIGAVAVILIVLALPRLGDVVRDQFDDNDEVPVELAGFWLPAENHVRFEFQVGDRREVLRPVGVSGNRETLGYAHYDSTQPGTPVTLTIESDPEAPVIITECYVAFLADGSEIQGEITGEGSRCHVTTVAPGG